MIQNRSFTHATVIKHTGSHYLLTCLPHWEPFEAVLRGRIRLKGDTLTNPLAVGDWVDGFYLAGGDAVITRIYPRRNYIIRKSTNLSRKAHIIAANVDTACLMVSARLPVTPLPFIDRFLVSCEAYRVPVVLIVNKCDLGNPDADFCEAYTRAGYRIFRVSAKDGTGIAALREELCGRIALFSGISGVGKSSVANAIDPDLHLKTDSLSQAHDTGRHTTTFYEMHRLANGGFFIDSPGIKGFGLIDMDRSEIYHFFPEIFAVAAGCKYNACLHVNEPGCAVREAVEKGLISSRRYESYLKLLADEGGKYRH